MSMYVHSKGKSASDLKCLGRLFKKQYKRKEVCTWQELFNNFFFKAFQQQDFFLEKVQKSEILRYTIASTRYKILTKYENVTSLHSFPSCLTYAFDISKYLKNFGISYSHFIDLSIQLYLLNNNVVITVKYSNEHTR